MIRQENFVINFGDKHGYNSFRPSQLPPKPNIAIDREMLCYQIRLVF